MRIRERQGTKTATHAPQLIAGLVLCSEFFLLSTGLQCRFSQEWRGRYFQSGLGEIVIKENAITTKGNCVEQNRDYFLFENKEQSCFSCLLLLRQHRNLIQYKESFCTTQSVLKLVCSQIRVETPLYTLVREPSLPIRCPFQDAYRFKYNDLSHGFCEAESSTAEPCASPSKYRLKFEHCEETAMYNGKELEFECLASWKDGSETYLYSRLSGTESSAKDDRYRCFKYHQYGSEVSLAMSADATCRGLRTAKDGPFLLEFVEDNSRWPPPSCHFPDWMKGVTWRDLIGRYRYYVDEHGEKLFKSFRNSSKDQISNLFRCRHITTNARHLPTDADEFVINTFETNNCQSKYQCLKFKKLSNRAVEIHIGSSQEKESHVYCQTDVYQNIEILTAEGSGSSPTVPCPRPGMHHTAPADGCIYRLNVGCRSDASIEIDYSCSPGKPGVVVECVAHWFDGRRSYVIVRHRQSDAQNCYSFREEQGLRVFGVDSLCNRNASLIGGQQTPPTYSALRHENCRRELRTTQLNLTALHKSPPVTMATVDNEWPIASEDYHRKDISIGQDTSSSIDYDDDDDDDDDEFYDEETDEDPSSGKELSDIDRFEETGNSWQFQGHGKGYRKGHERSKSKWISDHLNHPISTTIEAPKDKESLRGGGNYPTDGQLTSLSSNNFGPNKDQNLETKGPRKDLTPTKPHSTKSRSRSSGGRRSSKLSVSTVILLVLKILSSSSSV